MSKASALPVMMYHHVSPSPGLVTVAPDTFRSHLHALAKAGWQTAGLGTVERFFAGEPVSAKTCVITFDDGYLDNLVHAAPVLAELNMKAVIFAVTGWLGDGPPRFGQLETPDHRECKRRIAGGDQDSVMLRWSEVELLHAAGTFEFHSHTHTHTRWDKLFDSIAAKRAALVQDLADSRQSMEQHLGRVSRHLCWPQGYYDELYREVARVAGFDYLYTTEPRLNRPRSPADRIGRFVTKERDGEWLVRRTRLYANPWLGRLYAAIRA